VAAKTRGNGSLGRDGSRASEASIVAGASAAMLAGEDVRWDGKGVTDFGM
jgi:hypothetical protein